MEDSDVPIDIAINEITAQAEKAFESCKKMLPASIERNDKQTMTFQVPFIRRDYPSVGIAKGRIYVPR